MAAVAQKEVVTPIVASGMTAKLAKLLAGARYNAPSVVSFPLRGVVSTEQVSMVGNNT